jgi:hypothetical protein
MNAKGSPSTAMEPIEDMGFMKDGPIIFHRLNSEYYSAFK